MCNNYNGLLKSVFQGGGSMNSAALISDLSQKACESIDGSKLTDYAKNVVKDDGRGLEAGILLRTEEDDDDVAIWGVIISELFHRRRAFRRASPSSIGAEYVDIIGAGANQTSNSQTTPCGFHVYGRSALPQYALRKHSQFCNLQMFS